MTYKLIQREPTPEMIEAGFRSIMDGVDNRPGVSWADETTMAFHAIWDAAPQVDGYKLPELTTSEVLSLERRSRMTDDETIRFARSVESLMMRKARGITAQYQPAAQSTAAQEATVPVSAFDRLFALNESNAARIIELEDQIEQEAKDAERTCEWELTDDENMIWESACGQAWSFVDGGPAENNTHYCHCCGGKLVIAALSQSAKEKG